MAEIALRMLISLTLKDPVNMESVVFRDPKNITRRGVPLDPEIMWPTKSKKA